MGEGGGEGGMDGPGVPELIFVGLFHFAPIERCCVLEILGKLSAPRPSLSLPPLCPFRPRPPRPSLSSVLLFFSGVQASTLAARAQPSRRPSPPSHYFRPRPTVIHILQAVPDTALCTAARATTRNN